MSSAPVFVVGPARSGTTLMQAVLDRNSELYGRWGEKTPRHIFPRAHLLAAVRDPRAVVASYARWWKEHDLDAVADIVRTEAGRA